jgi:hypothetical protein
LFDLSFDHKVVEVKDVEDGNIDDIAIPIGMWDDMDKGTIRVFFTVPEATGGKEEGEEEQQPPPSITALVPTEEAVNSTEAESITFEISVDQEVDISWQINGTEMQTDEGVTKAAYTNTSAVAGTWNVSAIATSTETDLVRKRLKEHLHLHWRPE